MDEEKHFASAQPEKRLFITLLTRDISLVDAILDLVDNLINSALIQSRNKLNNPSDYIALLAKSPKQTLPKVTILFSDREMTISDTCGGISFADAEGHVFRFGRKEKKGNKLDDRLSVYGIGLKRALFKTGDQVRVTSAHRKGGFTMDLKVKEWERLPQTMWAIPISPFNDKLDGSFGTHIHIAKLFPDIADRIGDGSFESDLIRRISRTYNYFLEKIVRVEVNGNTVEPLDIKFGENTASETFEYKGVACTVIAGIAAPRGRFHVADLAGWYVFCNGRAVTFADKTKLTGWGRFLPSFQPKHRPFLGLVFFTSDKLENLPWTTTKSSINEEAAIWQHTLRIMGTVGKQITGYLDSRYSDDGTEITTDELTEVAGSAASAFHSIQSVSRRFTPAKKRRETTSIQFNAKIDEINRVKGYLGRRSMSNGEVGRHLFDYFLENVVEE